MIHNVLIFLSIYFPLIIVPLFISLLDFITLLRAARKKVSAPHDKTVPEEDFSILVPIFGDMKYLKNIEFLRPYGSKVVLCTTNKESSEFDKEIHDIAQKYNFRIFRSHVLVASKKAKPNPWKLFSRTLEGVVGRQELSDAARDEIIKDSFSVVHTKYCVFLDGDTVARERLQNLVGHFRNKKYDISSVRVLASKRNTLCEQLQGLEYELSMDARKIYPWLTSGACMVAKTEVIRDIMQHHSLFFSGGDIEIGKLARLMKYRVGYIPFVLYTDVPVTFKAWFKQRMAWCGGGFRHAIINAHRYTWRHPMFYLYTTIVVYGLTPIRWYEVIRYPQILPLVIVLYWVLLFVFRWKYRQRNFFYFPFYALVQIMFIVPLGIYTYCKMAFHGKNIGHIKLRGKKKVLEFANEP